MSPQLHSTPGYESDAYRWKALDISFRSPPVASVPRRGVTLFPHFPHFPHGSVAAYVKIEYFGTRFGGRLIRSFSQDCAKSERPCNAWGRRKPAWRPTGTYFGERLGKKLRKSRVLKSLKIIPNHIIWSLRVILRHISDFVEFTPLAKLALGRFQPQAFHKRHPYVVFRILETVYSSQVNYRRASPSLPQKPHRIHAHEETWPQSPLL